MLFKFRRAILNLKKCIINYVTLKSAAVTMRRVGVWAGKKVPDCLLGFFLLFQHFLVGDLHDYFHHSQANALGL